MERPAGAYILNEETGKLTPNMDDAAMKARQIIADEEANELAKKAVEDTEKAEEVPVNE